MYSKSIYNNDITVLYFSFIMVCVRVQFYFERAHYLFIYLIVVYI